MSEPWELTKESVFQKFFANSKTYNDPGEWLNTTFMVSKVDMKRKHRIIAPTDVQIFINNCEAENHKEFGLQHLLEYLEKHLRQHLAQNMSEKHHTLMDMEIFMSYSPCCSCAERIRDLMMQIGKTINVKVTIHIGTFYKIQTLTEAEPNALGLMNLYRTEGIELKTICRYKGWKRFLEIAELPLEWIKHTQTIQRVLRENVDDIILKRLKERAEELRQEQIHAVTKLYGVSLDCLGCEDCEIRVIKS